MQMLVCFSNKVVHNHCCSLVCAPELIYFSAAGILDIYDWYRICQKYHCKYHVGIVLPVDDLVQNMVCGAKHDTCCFPATYLLALKSGDRFDMY